jgi:NAD(P)-dependent dehydrogenase (short-subunit alcohol dehydrogenase family)
MSNRTELAGKTVVVTGASSGLGRGTAVKLGESGANVVVAARRGDVLADVVAEIDAAGGSGLAVDIDVSDPDDVAQLAAAAIDRFGRIDVWINNVGIGALGMFWEVPIEDHARVIDVNLKGLIFGAHVALRHFRDTGAGTLVNIGSVESEVPLAYQSSYAASKAAVLSLSRSLNEELRIVGESDTIKVGTVMPWAVDTPWWVHAANYTGRSPRMAAMDQPEVVVDAIVAACIDPEEAQPVGLKAHAATTSHRLLPDLTEHLSAKVADTESHKGSSAEVTSGSIHEPQPYGTGVSGGVEDRMKREDDADAKRARREDLP